MQDKPKAPDLLEAVGDFLMKEILPAVKDDDALAYKTLVSWNMLGVIAREFREGEQLARDEYARLAGLIGSSAPMAATYPELLVQLEKLNADLASEIRTKGWSIENGPVWKAVREGIREKLRVSNPRYGTE